MARRASATRSAQSEDGDVGRGTGERFKRVIAIIVALENYRKPSSGDQGAALRRRRPRHPTMESEHLPRAVYRGCGESPGRLGSDRR
jgi:hypothetical protein